MHDHLLGCHQFQVLEEEVESCLGYTSDYRPLRQGYPLGLPKRWHREMEVAEKRMNSKYIALEAFESKDHTPAHMQADFPHEYDLHTVYGDAATRGYYAGLKARDGAVPVSQSVSDWMKGEFDWKGEFDRACGVPEVKVMSYDYGRGDDMAAAIAFACAPYAKAVEETRAEIVARILADKQRLRLSEKPPALDL